MMDKKEVSERVKLALKAIREKEYTKKELRIFYNNINASDDITEDDKELLTNEIELKSRNGDSSTNDISNIKTILDFFK